MPRTPTGFYRSVWQAMDAAGCSRRVFPACAADAAGIKHRGDRWDPIGFNTIIEYMTNNNPAHQAEAAVAANLGLRDITLQFGPLWGGLPLSSGFFVWATCVAFDNPAWVAFLFHDVPGHTDIYDLRTMAHYTNLPGGWPTKWRSTGRLLLYNPPDTLGAPWLNPI